MESKSIRILHVIGIMNRGGAETMIMNLYRNIDRTKIQFDFVENEGEEAAFDQEIQSLGGRIYRCPRYRGKNHLAYTKWWHAFFDLHRGEYPIVHGHIGSTAAIYLSIAKRHGIYTIAHSHSAGKGSAMYQVLSWPTRYVANQFFACSKDAAISRYGRKVGNDADRCPVLNNAIDTGKFVFREAKKQQMRQQLHISESALVIGHVGRFVDAKNHLFLLDVFLELHKRDSNSVLLLVGDGELRSKIERKIQTLGLTDSVILTGVQSNTYDYYQAMDCFVFPSHYEGLGIVVIEAQTAGLPCCISTGVPREAAVTDLVQFRSLDDSPEQWAEWILCRIDTPRKDMSEEICKAGYDIAETSKWLENYYLEAVKNLDQSN